VSRNTSTVKEEKVQISKFQPIKSVNLSLNPRAKEKLPDNLNFSSDALLKKINSTLQANQYLNTNNLPTNISVEVLITNIRTRSGVTAIMLGPLAGGDYITGDVLIKDGANTIDKFEVDELYKRNIKYLTPDDINNNYEESMSKIINFVGNSPIHISFDVDAIDPEYIPSTGTHVKNGVQLQTAINTLDVLRTKKLVSLDITELNMKLGTISESKKSMKNTLRLFNAFLE
jgi:hypothetical protein